MTFNLPFSFCQTGWFQLAVWLLLALLRGSGHHYSALFLARSFSTWPGRDEDAKNPQKLMTVLFKLATWNTLIITYITLWLATSQILNSMFNRPKGKKFIIFILASPCKSQPAIGANRSPYISCIAPLPRMLSVVPPDWLQVPSCLLNGNPVGSSYPHSSNKLMSHSNSLLKVFRSSFTWLPFMNHEIPFWPLPMHLRLPVEGVVPPSGGLV